MQDELLSSELLFLTKGTNLKNKKKIEKYKKP